MAVPRKTRRVPKPLRPRGLLNIALVMVLLLSAVGGGAVLAEENTGPEPSATTESTTIDAEAQPSETAAPTETPVGEATEEPVIETASPTPEATEPPAPTETPAPTEPVTPEPTEPVSDDQSGQPLPDASESESPTVTATEGAGENLAPLGVEAQNAKELSLSVRSKGADFGEVTPDGMISGGSQDLQSFVVQDGADYVIPGAVTLKIKSDTDWTIICAIADLGSWGGASLASLSWRVSGGDVWQPIPSGEVILNGAAGTTTIEIDLRLHVSWTDGPGALRAIITYQAMGLPEP